MTHPCDLHAHELLAAYRSKSLSPVEACEAALARIDALNGTLAAYYFVDAERALTLARASEARWMTGAPCGLLDGVLFSAKDHVDVEGMPTLWGLPLAQPWPRSTAETPIVSRFREQGAIALGKTSQPELAAFCSGVTKAYPIARNPWDPARSPGGSSAGAAAAVATGMGPIAIGSDGGGSVRIPASYSGIFGFKPSGGRVPSFPPMPPFVVLGLLTRSVADAALALTVAARPEPRDVFALPFDGRDYRSLAAADLKNKRIGYCPDFGYGTPNAPEVAAAVDAAVRNLEALGATIVPVEPLFDYNYYNEIAPWYAVQFASIVSAVAGERLASLYEPLRRTVAAARAVTLDEYRAAEALAMQSRCRVADVMRKLDYLVSPTMPTTAYGAEELWPAGLTPNRFGYCYDHCPFLTPFNVSLQPACSLPCGFDAAGLPIGLQIVGRSYDDAGVLSAALCYEAAYAPVKRPPLAAH